MCVIGAIKIIPEQFYSLIRKIIILINDATKSEGDLSVKYFFEIKIFTLQLVGKPKTKLSVFPQFRGFS